jgi:hypothetical protein
MQTVKLDNAYYIKLGRGGAWEDDSIQTGKLRLGWDHQTIDDINEHRWELIQRQLREECREVLQGFAQLVEMFRSWQARGNGECPVLSE